MQRKLVYIISIVCMLFVGTPASAAGIPGIKTLLSATIPSSYENFSAVSSKNELLIASVSDGVYDEESEDVLYPIDLYKVTSNGAQKVTTIFDVHVIFVERSDRKVFMFAIDEAAATVDVYDENFQRVKTYALQNAASFINYEVFQHEQYVHITSEEGGSFLYNLHTLSPVASVALPVTTAASTGDQIQLIDALGQVQQTISFKDVIQKERYKRAYIEGNSIAVTKDRVTFAYMQEEIVYTNGYEDIQTHWYIATSDYNGHIFHKQLIPTSQSFYDFPEFLVTPTAYTIFLNGEIEDGYTHMRTYNAQTGVLSNMQPLSDPFDYIWERSADYFFAPLGFNEIAVYGTHNQQVQYTLTQEDALLTDLSNEYGIVNGTVVDEDGDYTVFHYTLFDVTSGKTVKKFETYNVEFVQNDFLVETSMNEESQMLTLYQLQTNNERPLPTTYEPSKMWTVTFNDAVDEQTVSNNTVYVLNAQQEKQSVTLRVNGKQVFIDAPAKTYNDGDYTLYIDGVSSTSGIMLEQPTAHVFTISQ